MATPKTQQVKTHIENCSFVNTSAANEHTRASVEALAAAIKANAEALIAVAKALEGAPAHMGTGLKIDG